MWKACYGNMLGDIILFPLYSMWTSYHDTFNMADIYSNHDKKVMI